MQDWTKEDLLQAVYEAFPARRGEPFDPLVNSIQGDETFETAKAFADKDDWTEIEGRWIDDAANGWSSALNFLSDKAMCFYLPAWLVADLRGELWSSDPTFQLCHGFTVGTQEARIWPRRPETWTANSAKRWSHLTPAQVDVVVGYLEWRYLESDSPVDYQLAEALDFYWYPRRASAG